MLKTSFHFRHHLGAIYSHILLNMKVLLDDFIFSETSKVLKPKGLNYFSIRNHNDASYLKGVEVDK